MAHSQAGIRTGWSSEDRWLRYPGHWLRPSSWKDWSPLLDPTQSTAVARATGGRPQLLREQVLGGLALESAWGGLAPTHLPWVRLSEDAGALLSR